MHVTLTSLSPSRSTRQCRKPVWPTVTVKFLWTSKSKYGSRFDDDDDGDGNDDDDDAVFPGSLIAMQSVSIKTKREIIVKIKCL